MPGHTLMKSARVSKLNAPWSRVLHLAARSSFLRNQVVDVTTLAERAYFYYIISGWVRLSYVAPGGEERAILYAGPGTLMNVPSVLAHDVENTQVVCTEDVELALFSASLLADEAFAAAHPDLMLNLIHSLSVHLVIHSQHLADSALAGSLGHVCRIFWEMSEKCGGRVRFRLDMTQQELAALLGIHRTTLTRILCRLKDMGVLARCTRSELHILDRERLAVLAAAR